VNDRVLHRAAHRKAPKMRTWYRRRLHLERAVLAAAAVALLVVIYFLAVIGYQMVTAPPAPQPPPEQDLGKMFEPIPLRTVGSSYTFQIS